MKKFILTVFLLTSFAGAAEYTCPEKISTQQNVGTVNVKEWKVMTDNINGTHYFEGITVYDGNPKEGASLVPDNEGDEDVSAAPFWTFTKKIQRGIWIACSYRKTSLLLTKQLPAKTKKCTLKQINKSELSQTISCK